MTLASLFIKATAALETKQPFVIYHLPQSKEVKAFFQKDQNLRYAHDFQEQGFIFSPFKNIDATILFPSKASEIFKVPINLEELSAMRVEERQTLITPSIEVIDEHIALVGKGIKSIGSKNLQKVVLSRALEVDTAKPAIDLYKALVSTYTEAFTYLWFHPEVGLWLGATPETLLTVNGNRFETMSLAGTQAYKGTLKVDWGQKERDEQQIVTNTIKHVLAPESRQLAINEAETTKAGLLLHLKTAITGTFKPSFSLKAVLEKLHPTPAICGYPKDVAKKFILENEHYNREFYTGFLGELNMPSEDVRSATTKNLEQAAYRRHRGISNLYVNLRCLKLIGNKATVYVGGGITADSIPEDEFWETHRKSQTMLHII